MAKTKAECGGSLGMAWFAGWLFSLGFLDLGFWKGLLGLLMWPYYIGVALAGG